MKQLIRLACFSFLFILPVFSQEVVKPTIRIIIPTGGESYRQRGILYTRWSSTVGGDATTTIRLILVNISLVGFNYRQLLTLNGTSNDGEQTVSIPSNTPPGRYKIEVSGIAEDSSFVSDLSDNYIIVNKRPQ